MSDETKSEAQDDEAGPPVETLERPNTDTKLISEIVGSDAAAAIRDALGDEHGDAAEGAEGAGSAPSPATAVLDNRLGTVEERLERLADLEDRFTRIEKAIDELKAKLDGDDD